MSVWRTFGQQVFTADVGSQSVYQRFQVPKKYLLLSVKTWMIFYNNPTFSGLWIELWSDLGGKPGQLLKSSKVRLKSELLTKANGFLEIPFDFSAPLGVTLQASDWYHLVINASGYTGDASSHISWMKAFPDPIYDTGYTPTFENLSIAPYQLSMIGAAFK